MLQYKESNCEISYCLFPNIDNVVMIQGSKAIGRLAPVSGDYIFILIILFDNPLKLNQSNIMTGH